MKKLLSIVLAVVIIIPFCSVFSIDSHAMDAGMSVAISQAIINATAGYATGLAANDASALGSQLGSINGDFCNNLTGVGNSRVSPYSISVSDSGAVTATANPDFADQEAATYMASKLNDDNIVVDILATSNCLTASDYKKLKSSSVNAYNKYLAARVLQLANSFNDVNTGLVDNLNFSDSWNNYAFSYQAYSTATLPQYSQSVNFFSNQGYTYTKPYNSSVIVSYYDLGFTSYEAAKSTGATVVTNVGPYYIADLKVTCYGLGTYLIYNDVVYYMYEIGRSSTSSERTRLMGSWLKNNANSYYDSNGVSLGSLVGSSTIPSSCYMGVFYITDPSAPSIFPVTSLSDSDFSDSSGGGVVEVPLKNDEKLVGQAMELGIAKPDSVLTLDENGDIVAVDGIDMVKLADLIEKMSQNSGNIKDYTDYLNFIIDLLNSSGLTLEQQKEVLDNIKNQSDMIAGSLASILEQLQDITIEVDTSISAPKEFDVDTPDSITDKFPFSLPFDIYHVFNLLSAEPEAPYFEVPFTYQSSFDSSVSFDESIVIDLSEYDWIANIVRWMLYIVFILGLILITNNLLGRG